MIFNFIFEDKAIPPVTMDSRLAKLIQMCKDHPKFAIDLEKYKTAEELMFCLWERNIDIGDLGFGHPCDRIFKGYVKLDKNHNPVCDLKVNLMYQSYLHSDKIPDYLYYALMLPKDHGSYDPLDYSVANDMLERYLDSFNIFWKGLGKEPITGYDDLREILKSNTLSKLDLCYLLWESDSYQITLPGVSVYDFIDRVK